MTVPIDAAMRDAVLGPAHTWLTKWQGRIMTAAELQKMKFRPKRGFSS
jgi:hypothetical protein